MDWTLDLVDRLARVVPGGYAAGDEATTEPTALAGLALLTQDRIDDAQIAANWLAKLQADGGSIGISPARHTPCWPTSLAILLWQAVERATGRDKYARSIERAVQWALAERGRTRRRGPLARHDTTLAGWSWAENTHSWVEPTAMFVLALKAVGHGRHPRTREAIRLLSDRLLPTGGCNYGNTIVLDQVLLPHVQPTGLAMMAFADDELADPRIELSLNYLEQELQPETTTASLCFGILGLAAHNRHPVDGYAWLENAYRRVLDQGPGCYKLALLSLAAAEQYPLSNVLPTGEPK
ncbi:MAG: hypothetical protein WD738_20730 [Pirellulales bacterium]